MKNQMKDLIADAFLALARQKSIDKITVKDLVDHCGISRQTFYYHFQDIFDVIEWQAQRVEQEASVRARQAESLEEAVRILVDSYLEHYALVEKLRDSQKRDFVGRLVMDSLQERLRDAVRQTPSDRTLHVSAEEADVLIRFFAGGLAGLFLAEGRSRPPRAEELTRQILIVFRRLSPQSGQD